MERVLIIEQDVQRMEEIRSALDGEYKLTSCSTQEEAIGGTVGTGKSHGCDRIYQAFR